MPVYFRPHNLLTTGDGEGSLKWGSTNAYREDASGNAIYDWVITTGSSMHEGCGGEAAGGGGVYAGGDVDAPGALPA